MLNHLLFKQNTLNFQPATIFFYHFNIYTRFNHFLIPRLNEFPIIFLLVLFINFLLIQCVELPFQNQWLARFWSIAAGLSCCGMRPCLAPTPMHMLGKKSCVRVNLKKNARKCKVKLYSVCYVHFIRSTNSLE